MLRTNTILPGTLDILNRVMSNPDFDAFTLVGGTALALQLGHRVSVDLDFFGSGEVDGDEFLESTHSLGKIRLMSRSRNILVVEVNGVKVDRKRFFDVVGYLEQFPGPVRFIAHEPPETIPG